MTLKNLLNSQDIFAAEAGAQVVEVSDGYACAIMTVSEHHLNAGGVCQGGALFTLADLALAAVMNCHGQLTFSIESNITFTRSAVCGDSLKAEAKEVFSHHRIPSFEVRITNQHGELVCILTAMAYRKDKTLPFSGLM